MSSRSKIEVGIQLGGKENKMLKVSDFEKGITNPDSDNVFGRNSIKRIGLCLNIILEYEKGYDQDEVRQQLDDMLSDISGYGTVYLVNSKIE